jgi:hypothetical protein
MTAQQILNALEVADEELLQETDRLRNPSAKHSAKPYKWIGLAACLCLLWGIAWHQGSTPSLPCVPTEPPATQSTELLTQPTESTAPTEEVLLWSPFYNETNIALDGALRQDIFLFSQTLTEDEVCSFAPTQKPAWMTMEGYALFSGDGLLHQVYFTASTSLPEVNLTIGIGAEKPFCCYVLPEDPQISYCNGVAYTLTRYTSPDGTLSLFAEAELNGCFFSFSLQGTQEALAQNEEDFALILQAFANSHVGLDELSAIRPGEIPLMYNIPLSHEEACNTEPYGAYFLPQVPAGFAEERIHSYRDQNTSYLAGLWTKGYDELSWRVSAYTEEDASRLTHAEDPQRYDLSLYPIPRADSVPDELREVVDNPIFYAEELTPDLIWARAYKPNEQGDSNGWRMHFSILCGDVVLTVRSKGVDPDWLWARLSALCADQKPQ